MEKFLKRKLKNGVFSNVGAITSKTMSAIRGKNNKTTERRLRMALIQKGIKGWKLHPDEVLGRPDIYFSRRKLAIFIDGCFWHGCPKCGHIPKTRSVFWEAKILRNKSRDKKNTFLLSRQEIKVVRIWECELKNPSQVLAKKLLSV